MQGGWRAEGEDVDTSRGIWAENQGNREPVRLDCEHCAQSRRGSQAWNVGAVVLGGHWEHKSEKKI